MDRVINIAETVAAVIASYECPSPMATMHYVHDEVRHIDLVLVIPYDRQIEPHIVVMTRLIGERAIVEIDTTDKPVEDELMASGIPRQHIVVAWRGETVTD